MIDDQNALIGHPELTEEQILHEQEARRVNQLQLALRRHSFGLSEDGSDPVQIMLELADAGLAALDDRKHLIEQRDEAMRLLANANMILVAFRSRLAAYLGEEEPDNLDLIEALERALVGAQGFGATPSH